jgi:hypothetical protein
MAKRLNKAEAAALALHDALAWPARAEPERIDDAAIKDLVAASDAGSVRLWTYNLGGFVSLGDTDGRNHSHSGPMRRDDFNSRGAGGPWYTTREEACLAMRWGMTRQAAKGLQSIDERIEALMASALPDGAPESAEEPAPRGP